MGYNSTDKDEKQLKAHVDSIVSPTIELFVTCYYDKVMLGVNLTGVMSILFG